MFIKISEQRRRREKTTAQGREGRSPPKGGPDAHISVSFSITKKMVQIKRNWNNTTSQERERGREREEESEEEREEERGGERRRERERVRESERE